MRLTGPDGLSAWVFEDVTDEHRGLWRIAARLFPHDGRLIIGELRIFPAEGAETVDPYRNGKCPEGYLKGADGLCYLQKTKPAKASAWEWRGDPEKIPEQGIESRLLRVPLGAFVRYAQDLIRREAAMPTDADRRIFRFLLEYTFPGATDTPRPRARRNIGRDDLFYARLADEYIASATKSRTPVKDIANRRGETPEHVRDLLHEARERGVLSKGEPGQPGGMLLPYGMGLLKKSQKAPTTKKPARRRRRNDGRADSRRHAAGGTRDEKAYPPNEEAEEARRPHRGRANRWIGETGQRHARHDREHQ